MALSFEGFKQKLFSLMQKNESNSAYVLVNPNVAGSGWSYGWCQWDLLGCPEIGMTTFLKILRNAYSIDKADTLYKAAQSAGGTGLSAAQRK